MPGELEKTLPCKLTREEREERGQEMAGLIQEIEAANEAEKERKKSVKAVIEADESIVAKLAEEISTGMTRREVRCLEQRNNDAGTMEIIRLDDEKCWPDGKKLVNARPLKPNEQQISMLPDPRAEEEGKEETSEDGPTDVAANGGEGFDANTALE